MNRLLLPYVLSLFVTTPLCAQTAKDLLDAAKAKERESAPAAIELYKKIIADYSADAQVCAEAHLRLGACLAEQGKRDEANAAIAKALELCPGRPDLRLLAEVAQFRLRDGPHQTQRVEVDRHGRAQLVTEMSERNASPNEQRFFTLHSAEGALISVRDSAGRPVSFLWQGRENGIEYTLKLNDPVPPGGSVRFETTWEMERLILRKGDRLLYHFNRPLLGQEALYEHALRLPSGADVASTSPRATLTRRTDEGVDMIWQKQLKAGEEFEIRVEFMIPQLDILGLAIPDYMEVINKQSNIITIDASGKAVARADVVERNTGRVPISQVSFSSGPRAKLLKVYDEDENLLVFVATPIDERTNYLISLRAPIPPGEERTIQSFYEVAGLVRKEGDLWVYQYRHSPGPETLYSHTLRLPPDAIVVEMAPPADDVALDEGAHTLSWTDVIARGAHFLCTVKYRLPEVK
ncbi:MAG: tetratricopeptide repeat protein [Planctomycetota bacterium]